jgi:hypothetical protein
MNGMSAPVKGLSDPCRSVDQDPTPTPISSTRVRICSIFGDAPAEESRAMKCYPFHLSCFRRSGHPSRIESLKNGRFESSEFIHAILGAFRSSKRRTTPYGLLKRTGHPTPDQQCPFIKASKRGVHHSRTQLPNTGESRAMKCYPFHMSLLVSIIRVGLCMFEWS